MKTYDHHEKAGNEGDVVKHVALIAALRSAIELHRGDVFRYADTFAGYAQNPIIDEGRREWRKGIGKLHGRGELCENQDIAFYHRSYLSRPKLEDENYPGSSRIAADVCTSMVKHFQLFLWDTCEKVISDLNREFGEQGHQICQSSADPSDTIFQTVDFLLIDPPDGDKKRWKSVAPFLGKGSYPLLIWWPILAHTTTPPSEHKQSQITKEEALKLGFSVSKVRWAKGGRTIGCSLIYRLSPAGISQLRDTVDDLVKVMGETWRAEHCNPAQKVRIGFRVNGREVAVDAWPMARLLDVLREELRLTGAKEGCGEGECGACSVLLDGELVNSCLVPALQAHGASITTIEGVADGDQLHAVQQAFIECGGAQCGICTPGMVLAAVTLLERCPNPTDADIRNGLAGNLCRCTGYTKIFESVVRACEGKRKKKE